MQRAFSFKLLPSEASNDFILKKYIAQAAAVKPTSVSGYNFQKRSIDARGKQPWINVSLIAFINEPWQKRILTPVQYPDVHHATSKVIVVGAGPAGLFAALRLIEAGIKPIILERGKDVRARRRDLALLNKEGLLNPESNYCFGEGGAGTYSDGKLYTRSTKRGDVDRILNLFVRFGADENILYESHPHIGTNKLPHIITEIRTQIVDAGGEFLFEKKVVDLVIKNERIISVRTSDENTFAGEAVILATGHSARDIFYLLHDKKIKIEAKPFALGVRAEHPQELINEIQYHCDKGSCDPHLPPASYSLVQQIGKTGVFSFCMCPGGIIAPASTDPGELVVNGWSPSKRNNPYANSGIVVQVQNHDLQDLKPARLGHSGGDFKEINELSDDVLNSSLGMMYFQQYVERKSYHAGGGRFVAPAQRLVDFCQNRVSSSLPACSYLPGVSSASLKEALPASIHKDLQLAFREFGKKMKGYFTNEAIVVATESRTSSPVRIPRDPETLQHIQVKNLYPCGEGAGYAGGIVSAAMDGERVASRISLFLSSLSSK
jgi:uncharacterized FAD-dependent dehydrogenase